MSLGTLLLQPLSCCLRKRLHYLKLAENLEYLNMLSPKKIEETGQEMARQKIVDSIQMSRHWEIEKIQQKPETGPVEKKAAKETSGCVEE